MNPHDILRYLAILFKLATIFPRRYPLMANKKVTQVVRAVKSIVISNLRYRQVAFPQSIGYLLDTYTINFFVKGASQIAVEFLIKIPAGNGEL